MKKNLGDQLTVDFYNCNASIINDVNVITEILEKGAEMMNLSVVNTTIHEFSPIGISGVVVIKESHIAIHTWPEHNFVALDFFTCNHENNLEEGIEWLKNKFESNFIEKKKNYRGNLELIASKKIC